jgi:hypothetical protein
VASEARASWRLTRIVALRRQPHRRQAEVAGGGRRGVLVPGRSFRGEIGSDGGPRWRALLPCRGPITDTCDHVGARLATLHAPSARWRVSSVPVGAVAASSRPPAPSSPRTHSTHSEAGPAPARPQPSPPIWESRASRERRRHELAMAAPERTACRRPHRRLPPNPIDPGTRRSHRIIHLTRAG